MTLTKLQVDEKPPPFAESDRNQEHANLWSQLVLDKNVGQNHRCRLFDLAAKVLFVKWQVSSERCRLADLIRVARMYRNREEPPF